MNEHPVFKGFVVGLLVVLACFFALSILYSLGVPFK